MTAAHETSTAFSDKVLKEHDTFELSKQQEMKEMLGNYADGQVEMLQRAMDDWDRVSPRSSDLTSALTPADNRLSPFSSVSGWTCRVCARGV